MNAEIRRPLLRGSQLVRALWFDPALIGETEARRRLLAAWETGAQAHRLGEGYLLAWKTARRLRCEGAPGLPLSDQDGVLASAVLLPQEREGIAPGSAVLVLSAHLRVHALDAGTRIDPASWIDVSAIPVCVALAPSARSDAGFVSAATPAAPDVRTLLGPAVPPPSARREAFLRAAARQGEHGMSGNGLGGGRSFSRKAAGAAAGAAGMLAGLLLLPLSLFGARRGGDAGTGGRGAGSGPDERLPSSRRSSSRFGDWLAARAARLAAATRIAQLIGWRQANYLRKMLRQFEEGNLDEALRHAIPLDSRQAPGRQAFGTGSRRDKLEIGAGASAASIGLDDESIGLLRQTYQRSFDMLDRAGRIDEAVFVLAELLNRHQEAVDYLERKERVEQAARLAETLELPLAAVRLHSKARNVARAVLLARLNGCFAEVVSELDRRGDPGAAGLRLEWALDLAARGYLAEAAQAVWPLAAERPRALAWLQAAEQGGGAIGVQGLMYTLVLDPQALRARSASLQALLSTPGPEALQQRLRACECLLVLDSHNEATRRVAAALWRVLAAERGAGLHALPGVKLGQLLKLSGDAVLAEDLPRTGWGDAPVAVPLASRRETLHVRFDEEGLHALEDVRALPDGGHLLALGEGGVVLAREAGRAPLRFPVPANHLVVSHNGRRALALARREKAVRVSRIDLVTGKVDDWFSADLRFWAGAFDGATWSVVAGGRLMVLDAAAQDRSVLWQVGELPGAVIGFDQQGTHEALLMRLEGAVEQWRYALPARRLLARDRVPVADDAFAVLPDCGEDAALMVGIRKTGPDGGTCLWISGDHRDDVDIAWPHAQAPQVSLHEGLLLLRFDADDGWHCRVLNRRADIVADIVLPGAASAHATLRAGHLLAWDRRGRVVDVDIGTSAVRTLTFG